MIKDNQQYFNRLHVIIDALVIAGSYILAWYFYIGSNQKSAGPAVGVLGTDIYFSALYFVVPAYLALYYWFHLYSSKRVQRSETEILNVCKANIVGMTVFLAVLFMAKDWNQLQHFSRGMVGVFCAVNTVSTILVRAFIRYFLHFVRKKGYNRKYILLVGYSRAAEEYINRINSNPQWGYVVRGILDDKVPRGATYKGVKVLGSIDNLLYILPENKLDEIAITLSLESYDRLEELVDLCEKSGVHTKFIPDYNSLIPGRPYMEDLMGLPVINIRYVPLTNTLNAIAKRCVDVAGAFLGLILISPLLLVVAVAVKATSKGPVIFRQERVGLHNKPFMMYKFRTMRLQQPGEERRGWTVKGDPRVTKVGALLRRTSIDELPQLFNVLMGDMSLVGPRPERPQFVEKFKEEIPRYMIKHQVRPGMTGWAQINGYRGDTSIRKRIEYDIYYIENWSMALDIKILFLTFFKGFINENAY